MDDPTRTIHLKQNGKVGDMKSIPTMRRRRQRWRVEKSMLFLLAAATLLPFSLTLAGSDKDYKDGNVKDFGWKDDFGLNENRPAMETEFEQGPTAHKRMATVINIFDPTNSLLGLLKSTRSKERHNRVWVVLAYRESCKECIELLRKLRDHAIPRINFDYDSENSSENFNNLEINFVPIVIDANKGGLDFQEEFLHRLGILRLPSLFFLWDQEKEIGSVLNWDDLIVSSEIYRGRSDSVLDLANGLRHYLSRFQLRSGLPSKTREYEQSVNLALPLTTIRVESLRDLQDIFRNGYQNRIFQDPPLPLDPDLSNEDDEWIRYLMDDESGVNNISPDNDHLYDIDINDKQNDDNGNENEKGRPKPRLASRETYHIVIQCRNMMGMQISNEKEDDVENMKSPKQQSSMQHSIIKQYEEYNQAAKVLGTSRHILFLVLEPRAKTPDSIQFSTFCNSSSDDGAVKLLDLHFNKPPIEGRIDGEHEAAISEGYMNNSASIVDNLRSQLLPSLLWFDRRMTAPIAFHPQHRRHAILIVDFDDFNGGKATRDIIRVFRDQCRRVRKKNHRKVENLKSMLNQSNLDTIDVESDENSLVCLVVPSTEIRILNTFGIDIWSHLDQQAIEKIRTSMCPGHDRNETYFSDDSICDDYYKSEMYSKDQRNKTSNVSPALPTLLVTDRRDDGSIQRHYLDSPINKASLIEFVEDFVHGRTEPEIKSSARIVEDRNNEDGPKEDPTNKHFVNILTAETLPPFLEAHRERHVMIQLYAPTCGHCKRFNTIWNSLGKLIKFLGWSDQLVLARIDVTTNEISVPGMAAAWLPDLFYFGIDTSENPIHYGQSSLADEVELGSISDPLDLLEWWMDEAGDSVDEAELLKSLNQVITNST